MSAQEALRVLDLCEHGRLVQLTVTGAQTIRSALESALREAEAIATLNKWTARGKYSLGYRVCQENGEWLVSVGAGKPFRAAYYETALDAAAKWCRAEMAK